MKLQATMKEGYSVPLCETIQIEVQVPVLGTSGNIEDPVDDGEWNWE